MVGFLEGNYLVTRCMVDFLQENYLVSRCMYGWFSGRELSCWMYAWSVFWKGINQFIYVCMAGFLAENYLVSRCMVDFLVENFLVSRYGWFSGRELSSFHMYVWLVFCRRII